MNITPVLAYLDQLLTGTEKQFGPKLTFYFELPKLKCRTSL